MPGKKEPGAIKHSLLNRSTFLPLTGEWYNRYIITIIGTMANYNVEGQYEYVWTYRNYHYHHQVFLFPLSWNWNSKSVNHRSIYLVFFLRLLYPFCIIRWKKKTQQNKFVNTTPTKINRRLKTMLKQHK